MVFASGFSWFHLIPAVHDDTLLQGLGPNVVGFVVLHSWLVCGAIIVLALAARMAIAKARQRKGIEAYFADDKLTLRNAAEFYAEGLIGVMAGMLPRRDVQVFLTLIGSFFAYIFCSNMLAVIPGFQPPTDNINTNVGMAFVSFLVFMFVGLSRDWKGFLKHLWGPLLLLGPLLFPIEVLGLVLRPLTLTVRLTANIFGDHLLFGSISDLAGWIVPIPFLGLGIFVAFIQAFVFSLLSTIYIVLSLPHEEHEEH